MLSSRALTLLKKIEEKSKMKFVDYVYNDEDILVIKIVKPKFLKALEKAPEQFKEDPHLKPVIEKIRKVKKETIGFEF